MRSNPGQGNIAGLHERIPERMIATLQPTYYFPENLPLIQTNKWQKVNNWYAVRWLNINIKELCLSGSINVLSSCSSYSFLLKNGSGVVIDRCHRLKPDSISSEMCCSRHFAIQLAMRCLASFMKSESNTCFQNLYIIFQKFVLTLIKRIVICTHGGSLLLYDLRF